MTGIGFGPGFARPLLTCLTLIVIAGGGAAWAQNGMPTKGAPAPALQVPITIGAGWSATPTVPPAFFWNAPGVVLADDTYEFDGRGCVSVTDDFEIGDQFRIYDNMVAVGDTSVPGMGAGGEIGPDAAYADPAYSSGTFVLGSGSHSISIEVILNPLGSGRGYIRVDPAGDPTYCPTAPTVPGPGLAALLAALLLLGALAVRHRGAGPALDR